MSYSKPKLIKVLIVEPGKDPYPKEIPNTLESLQGKVEGLVQALYPFEMLQPLSAMTKVS